VRVCCACVRFGCASGFGSIAMRFCVCDSVSVSVLDFSMCCCAAWVFCALRLCVCFDVLLIPAILSLFFVLVPGLFIGLGFVT